MPSWKYDHPLTFSAQHMGDMWYSYIGVIWFWTLIIWMKKLSAEKLKVSGEVPAPRFGHTFTMVSSTRAVLFGGAVSQGGTPAITQASSSSPTRPTSSTSSSLAGQGSTSNTILYHPNEQHTQQWQCRTCRWLSMEEQPQAIKDCSKINSTYSICAKSKAFGIQSRLEDHRSQPQNCHPRATLRSYHAFQQALPGGLWRQLGKQSWKWCVVAQHSQGALFMAEIWIP